MVDEPTCLGCRGMPNGCRSSLNESVQLVAAHGGAIWHAAAAIIYPSCQDGWETAFVAAVAPAQGELWLQSGVVRKPSACAEQCCVRERARLGVPATVLESQLPALSRDSRRVRWRARFVVSIFSCAPPRAGCPPLCVVLKRKVDYK